MATELIYFRDPRAHAFDARVVAVGAVTELPDVPTPVRPLVLDRTAFYPGGGGQPCDTGSAGSLPVLAVSHLPDQPDVVAHWVAADATALPCPGDVLHCTVDLARRFDLMQQHTGQHIISAVAMRDHGAPTTGFHLTPETATVDLAIPPATLSDAAGVEQFVHAVEAAACEVVFANPPVHIHLVAPGETPAAAAADGLSLRVRERGPAPKGEEKWRVIEVAGLDLSPCGGTHVESAGQVGLITVQRWEKIRDAVRLEFTCGRRALAAHRWRRDDLRRQAQALSVGERDAVDQALRSLEELAARDRELRALRTELLTMRADRLAAGAEQLAAGALILLRDDTLSPEELKTLANALCAEPGRVALLASAAGGLPRLVFARSDDLTQVNAGRLLTEAAARLGGRGGGPPRLGQGGGGDAGGLPAVLDWAAAAVRGLLG